MELYVSPEPGDKVKISREVTVDLFISNKLSGPYIRTTSGFYYSYANWKIEPVKEEKMSNLYNKLSFDNGPKTGTHKKGDKVTAVRDLRCGDKIVITREIEVRKVDSYDNYAVVTKDGRRYRLNTTDADNRGWGVKSLPAFDATWATDNTQPESWPPVLGDVWEANGNTYLASKTGYAGSVTMVPADQYNNYSMSTTDLAKKNPVLKYRKGTK